MRRAIAILIGIGLAVAAALWLAANPGQLRIEAGDWLIDAPLWVAGAVLLVVLILVGWIARVPGRLKLWGVRRRARRTQKARAEGDAALVRAFAALASGEGQVALVESQAAQARLGETPMTLLVAGHAARATGDRDAASSAFRTLASSGGDSAFLGQRGLASLAIEAEDQAGAAAAAAAALVLRPNAGWARTLALDDAVRRHDWATALRLMPETRQGAPQAERRAAILLAAAEEEGDAREALRLTEEAAGLAPRFTPAQIALARRLEERGDLKRARRVLERAFIAAPEPGIAALILEKTHAAEDPRSRARRVAMLAGEHVETGEAALAAARAAADAGDQGEARRQLGIATRRGLNDRRVPLLLAEIAESSGGMAEAERHLRDASVAASPPGWRCTACGTEAETWSAACRHCGAVAALERHVGPAAAGTATAIPPVKSLPLLD